MQAAMSRTHLRPSSMRSSRSSSYFVRHEGQGDKDPDCDLARALQAILTALRWSWLKSTNANPQCRPIRWRIEPRSSTGWCLGSGICKDTGSSGFNSPPMRFTPMPPSEMSVDRDQNCRALPCCGTTTPIRASNTKRGLARVFA